MPTGIRAGARRKSSKSVSVVVQCIAYVLLCLVKNKYGSDVEDEEEEESTDGEVVSSFGSSFFRSLPRSTEFCPILCDLRALGMGRHRRARLSTRPGCAQVQRPQDLPKGRSLLRPQPGTEADHFSEGPKTQEGGENDDPGLRTEAGHRTGGSVQ